MMEEKEKKSLVSDELFKERKQERKETRDRCKEKKNLE